MKKNRFKLALLAFAATGLISLNSCSSDDSDAVIDNPSTVKSTEFVVVNSENNPRNDQDALFYRVDKTGEAPYGLNAAFDFQSLDPQKIDASFWVYTDEYVYNPIYRATEGASIDGYFLNPSGHIERDNAVIIAGGDGSTGAVRGIQGYGHYDETAVVAALLNDLKSVNFYTFTGASYQLFHYDFSKPNDPLAAAVPLNDEEFMVKPGESQAVSYNFTGFVEANDEHYAAVALLGSQTYKDKMVLVKLNNQYQVTEAYTSDELSWSGGIFRSANHSQIVEVNDMIYAFTGGYLPNNADGTPNTDGNYYDRSGVIKFNPVTKTFSDVKHFGDEHVFRAWALSDSKVLLQMYKTEFIPAPGTRSNSNVARLAIFDVNANAITQYLEVPNLERIGNGVYVDDNIAYVPATVGGKGEVLKVTPAGEVSTYIRADNYQVINAYSHFDDQK